jgi:hypothetical protein
MRQSPVRGDSIESSLETSERKKAFFELADRLAATSDRTEQKRLKDELARLTFGEP